MTTEKSVTTEGRVSDWMDVNAVEQGVHAQRTGRGEEREERVDTEERVRREEAVGRKEGERKGCSPEGRVSGSRGGGDRIE